MPTDDDQLPTDDGDKNPVRDRMKHLEQQTTEQAQLIAELTKTNAFLTAGVNPGDTENPMVRYFVKGYDGDLDPTAIREAAVAAKVIAPVQAPVPEQQAMNRMEDATSAATAPQTAQDRELEMIRGAKTKEELDAAVTQINAQRAQRGA